MKLIHFADLHLGIENYGRIDPATGMSSRLIDFLAALDQVVDYALDNRVDLVVFCGDAYKTREPTQTQQREFAKRINRLSTGGIPIFLLTGNHDLPNAVGRATAIEIFGTLTLKDVYVANRPGIYPIPTASGTLQVVALPWLRRSSLLSKEETKNLTFEQINGRLQELLTQLITGYAQQLDSALPSILAAHVWVNGAAVGSEGLMNIGQEHVLLPGTVANPAFDYVALGHIHRKQVLNNSPPVAYSGSLECVDFSEAGDKKGFYVVEIQPDGNADRRKVSFHFQQVTGRPFCDISVTIEENDVDPTATIIQAITAEQEKIKDAIFRLNLKIPTGQESHLQYGEIKSLLKEAHYFTIAREIRRETRMRMGRYTTEEMTPLHALKMYLEAKKVAPERAALLLEYGQKLLDGESDGHPPGAAR